MINIKSSVDLNLINKYIADELLLAQIHPDAPLMILNYSRKVQFEGLWDEITLLCRGLIINSITGDIVARPFIKFFNYEQHKPEEIPVLPFEAYDKMDGSLGILYWWNGVPYIASRGSFQSDQAKHANGVFHSRYTHTFDKLNKGATYLFEIIYRQNRIVVDYEDMDDLVLLAVIENSTGNDLPLEDIGFPVVKRYDGVKDWSTLRDDKDMFKEGYIIRFSNGFRMKLKYEEYCRLHTIVTNVSNVSVWEILMANKPITELLERTPDEFDNFVKKTAADLTAKFQEIEIKHIKKALEFLSKRPILSRKEIAEIIFQLEGYNSKILFEMNDGRNYSGTIWRMIKPRWAKPFMIDDEN